MSWFSLWIAYYTIARRELLRFLRIWPQTLLPPGITAFLYFVIFGTFIGEKVGEVAATPYVTYIVPGLVMMSVINNAYANVVGSFYIAKFQRDIEELLVAAVPPPLIVAGYVTGGVARGFVVGALVYAIALLFTPPEVAHPWLALLFMLLTSLLFSMGGLINGIFARKFDDLTLFSTFILIPLTYFGGVFYAVEALPPLWRLLSHFNPILYMVGGFRFALLEVEGGQLLLSIGLLLLLCAVLVVTCLELLRRGVGLKS